MNPPDESTESDPVLTPPRGWDYWALVILILTFVFLAVLAFVPLIVRRGAPG